ncbi:MULTISPECIES: MAPEG family protein [unclassified Psychrobacter]|uniref:MAPEG family protein n=1 Tax=unclassified Psychrobacter TaxID=196806 RepID=UPI001889454F|nr:MULTISPECIES: MAPEG family protein [unclassified Psychrobacter]MBF2720505.1 MAPEG family protein [Psychrobacter sp. NG254]MBI0427009.1 MAPEG family protein [Psychrobacter sp. NG27]
MNAFFELVSNTSASAIWAMVAASLLPWLVSIVAKASGGFKVRNNAHPRDFFQNATGVAARANAAQQNSYETLPIFLAAVLTAMLFFVPQSIINILAWLYVLIRIGFCVAYITNLSMFRSILWALSMACCLMLFYLAIRVSV